MSDQTGIPNIPTPGTVYEKDLIPNGDFVSVIPDWPAPEGKEVHYLNGSTYRRYRMVDGQWRTWPLFPISPVTTYTPLVAATATLLLSAGNIHHITMPAGNINIAVTGEAVGQCFLVRILQDSVGGRTVGWFSGIRWAGGVTPTLSTGSSKVDTFGFEVTAAGQYDGFIVGQGL